MVANRGSRCVDGSSRVAARRSRFGAVVSAHAGARLALCCIVAVSCSKGSIGDPEASLFPNGGSVTNGENGPGSATGPL